MSPRDYSPVAIASAVSNDNSWGLPVTLSIQCRGGRTDMVLASGSFAHQAERYTISYIIADGREVTVSTIAPPSGMGIALKGDVVGLLQALPAKGSIVFRIVADGMPTLEGRYALPALKGTLQRLAGPCKWPDPTRPH